MKCVFALVEGRSPSLQFLLHINSIEAFLTQEGEFFTYLSSQLEGFQSLERKMEKKLRQMSRLSDEEFKEEGEIK